MKWRKIYVKLIIAKRWTIDDLNKEPELKEQVLGDLKALGYDGYGNRLPEDEEN